MSHSLDDRSGAIDCALVAAKVSDILQRISSDNKFVLSSFDKNCIIEAAELISYELFSDKAVSNSFQERNFSQTYDELTKKQSIYETMAISNAHIGIHELNDKLQLYKSTLTNAISDSRENKDYSETISFFEALSDNCLKNERIMSLQEEFDMQSE